MGGDRPNIVAHNQIPCLPICNQAYSPGEGDQGAYGVESAEPVGEMMTIGMCLLGGVGRPSLWDDGSSRFRNDLFFVSNEVVDQGSVCRSMGAAIRGCCSSGMPLLVVGFTVTIYSFFLILSYLGTSASRQTTSLP